VIVAPETTLSVGSVTVPVIAPRSDCPKQNAEKQPKRMTIRRRENLFAHEEV